MRLPARVGLAVVALGHLALVSGQCANEPITFEEIDCSYNADPAWPAVTTSVAAPERTPDSGGSGNLWYRFTNNLDVPAKILLNTADGAAGGARRGRARARRPAARLLRPRPATTSVSRTAELPNTHTRGARLRAQARTTTRPSSWRSGARTARAT